MIEKIEFTKSSLNWVFNSTEYSYATDNIKNVIGDSTMLLVLYQSGREDNVKVLSPTGSVIMNIASDDLFYIMYLQNHPRFGIGVVCSEEQVDGSWKDGFYTINADKKTIDKVTQSR